MKKKGGIFLIGIIVIVILIAGLFWFIKNMNVETDVNVDFSRKEGEKLASVKCIQDGFTLELRLNNDNQLYGVCIDNNNKECNEEAYYEGTCTLENNQGDPTINESEP